MSTQINLVHSLCRTHLDFFVHQVVCHLNPGNAYDDAPHVGAMCYLLERVHRGEITKAIITVPPRYLKSTVTSVAYVAWALGHDPTLKIVVASYGEKLSREHADQFRSVVTSDWYRAMFPRFRIDPRRNTAMELKTAQGGGRRAVSLGGALTGMGADMIIIDDLMKADEGAMSATERENARDYYEQTLYSRLDDKARGRIVVVQQRLHEDDIVGYLLEKGQFEHLTLPAIARRDEVLLLPRNRQFVRRIGEALSPVREPLEVLETEIRKQVGNTTFEAQWQQDPTTSGADLLRVEHFKRYGQELKRRHTLYTVQTWDTAYSESPNADWSVCMTFCYHLIADAWLLMDVTRVRHAYAELESLAWTLRKKWRADKVLIEDTSTGRALCQSIRRMFGPIAFCLPVRDGKEERLATGSPAVYDGKVLIPREALWLQAFFSELRKFPQGKHDDQVDALSLFLNWLQFPATEKRVASAIAQTQNGKSRRRTHEFRPRKTLREHILDSYDPDAPSLALGGL